MKKSVPLLLFFLSSIIAHAQERTADDKINDWVKPATDFISEIIFFSFPITEHANLPLILVWLLIAGLFFTFYLRFINVRGFRTSIKIVKGEFAKESHPGEVSHFQALATALSGTLGLGNISGVAVAIALGGPGATVWMIVAGLIGMSSKFAECTLGVKYRKENPDGSVSGGPMYFLSRGFADRGFPLTGKILAAFFAVMCIGGALGGGNMFQINQAAKQIIEVTGGEKSFLFGNAYLIGIAMAVLTGIVIIGGIKSIANWTEKLVPFMCILYMLAGFIVLFVNWRNIPDAAVAIINGAFAPSALYGGVAGVMIMGFRRASFSNEAGIGSASIAHSAVKTNEPVTEGLVSLLEPFIDTVVVCTMTALVIVITGVYEQHSHDGILLTSYSFATVIWWFPYVLSIAVVLFAFATMISWSYYGLKSWTYLFGEGRNNSLIYKFIFCLFVVIGSSMELTSVVDFSDAMIFAMSIPNIVGLYLLAPEVKSDLNSFWKKIKTR